MKDQKKKRSLTGIRPSGDLHIGNYLGTIKPALELQTQYQCLYFIADMHALTTTKVPSDLHRQTYDIVAAWIALGLDTKDHLLYRQSDLPMVAELMWYLSCVTGLGLLEKAHAYKDAATQDKEVNHGVFAYPTLMAADILLYEPDVVPVGKDQKQHVEMARDMAGSLNAIYGEGLLKLPAPSIDERVMTVPGLDGRKMSKSYNNVIPLFADDASTKKRVMSIKTDSTALEEPKELKGTLVGELFALFADAARYGDIAKRMKNGGMGWGHAKEELAELINTSLRKYRVQYSELRADESSLDKILSDGAERAYAIGAPVLTKVRAAVGIGPRKNPKVGYN